MVVNGNLISSVENGVAVVRSMDPDLKKKWQMYLCMHAYKSIIIILLMLS